MTVTLPPLLESIGIVFGTLFVFVLTWSGFPAAHYLLIRGDEANDWEFVLARALALVVTGLTLWGLISISSW